MASLKVDQLQTKGLFYDRLCSTVTDLFANIDITLNGNSPGKLMENLRSLRLQALKT